MSVHCPAPSIKKWFDISCNLNGAIIFKIATLLKNVKKTDWTSPTVEIIPTLLRSFQCLLQLPLSPPAGLNIDYKEERNLHLPSLFTVWVRDKHLAARFRPSQVTGNHMTTPFFRVNTTPRYTLHKGTFEEHLKLHNHALFWMKTTHFYCSYHWFI